MVSIQPNILLVIFDSARAQNTSLHGHYNETTPFLSELASEATVYEQARSPSIHSIASHASIWSGFHVEEHGCIKHESRLNPSETVWDDLTNEGYEVGLFTPNTVVTHSSNLSDCFDVVHSPDPPSRDLFPDALSPADIEETASYSEYLRATLKSREPIRGLLNGLHAKTRTNEPMPTPLASESGSAFLDWEAKQDKPWGACLNFTDPHYPYLPTEEYDLWGDDTLRDIHKSIPPGPLANQFLGERQWWQLAALTALYDGGIRQADAQLQRLVAELKRRGEYEDTLLVVTSDHGEGFGERSRLRPAIRMVDHSWGIHEVLTHVPLVVKYPGQTVGETVKQPATLTKFRDVVRDTLDGTQTGFQTERAISSTFRMLPDDTKSIDSDIDMDRFVGPWRAVYESDGSNLIKYASVGDSYNETATIEVHDAQSSHTISDEDGGRVEAVFSDLSDADVSMSSKSVDSDVESRLSELGYIR